MPFSEYIGNETIVSVLRRMMTDDRLPQTMLFAGPLGVGKATLARFMAAAVNCHRNDGDFCGECSSCLRTLAADLSKSEYLEQAAEREKMPAAKRNEAPLTISTHPDFLIFPPDGPLRMISIDQARQLRKAAQFSPSEGRRRVFVIDHAERANDEAANSLLKTLEEPAPALTIILTSEKPFELLPTIRSRSVPFYFSPLTADEMDRYFEARTEFSAAERTRLGGWAQGSPGRAFAMDADEYLARREAMLALIRTALGTAGFGEMAGRLEGIARKSGEKIELLVEMAEGLLRDLLHLRLGSGRLINGDIREELRELAERVELDWVDKASRRLGELNELGRRNIQKQVALEALAIGLRRARASR